MQAGLQAEARRSFERATGPYWTSGPGVVVGMEVSALEVVAKGQCVRQLDNLATRFQRSPLRPRLFVALVGRSADAFFDEWPELDGWTSVLGFGDGPRTARRKSVAEDLVLVARKARKKAHFNPMSYI